MKPLTHYAYVLMTLLAMALQCCLATNTQVSANSEQTENPALTPFQFSENLSCWPILPLQKGNNIKGSVLFESRSNDGTVFAWDVNSFHIRNLDDAGLRNTVSSDGTFVATLGSEKNKVVITSPTDTKTYTLPEQYSYAGLQFLPNGLMYVGIFRDEFSSNYTTSGFTDQYYILNPDTGDFKYNAVFLPNFTLGPRVYRFPIEYSPDLQHVVYKTTPDKYGNYRFALMKVGTSETVWTGNSMPHWKPDGSLLTYSSDNIFSLSKVGESKQVTWFEQKALSGIGPLYEEIPSSFNGRYMAFHQSQPALRLFYVWDNQEKIAFRPCLPDELRAYSDYRVYWSPDSNFLLIRLVYPDAKPTGEQLPPTHSLDFILDMANQTIYTLPDEKNRGEYSSQATMGAVIKGWVNWEIP